MDRENKMFWNYLIVALRNLLRNRVYTYVNVIGLGIGMGCCVMIMLFVQDELKYDRFHENADRIYRVLWQGKTGKNVWLLPVCSARVGEELARYPDVAQIVRLNRDARGVRLGNVYVREEQFFYVENSFFDVFTVQFIAGSAETALNNPDAVVITDEVAKKYFGSDAPLGKTLALSDGSLLTVTGVVKGFPPQSHFRFDFLASINAFVPYQFARNKWGEAITYTYVLLQENVNPSQIEARLQKHVDSLNLEGQPSYSFEPITDIYLHSRATRFALSPHGSAATVYTFALVGGIILLLACMNFINLTTAQMRQRMREIGMRKVLGADRTSLITQFLLETFGYVIVATIFAMMFCELGMSIVNDLSGKKLSEEVLLSRQGITLFASTAFFVVVAAGVYPAFILSGLQPVQVLFGHLKLQMRGGMQRGCLIVFQFTISIFLIIATLVVDAQLKYAQQKKLGFDKEHLLAVHVQRQIGRIAYALRDRLADLPESIAVSFASAIPGQTISAMAITPEQPALERESSLLFARADEYYVDVLDLHIIEGRNFAPLSFPSDSTAFLINQAAVQAIGWKGDAIGKRIGISGELKTINGPVIGIVENFHIESLYNPIQPLVIPFLRGPSPYILIRFKPGTVADQIATVQRVWSKIVPDYPFKYSFVDEDIEQLYASERRTGKVFQAFAAVAIFIACLGLYGLSFYIGEQKKKEIAVRKVLGCSEGGIVGLILKDIAKLIVVSFVIAAPISYYAMGRWLAEFAYQINLSPWSFLLAGMMAMTIGMVTVSWQAIAAARTNPVDTLKNQ